MLAMAIGEGHPLNDELLRVADTIATALRKRSKAGNSDLVLHQGDRWGMIKGLAAIDSIIDEQTDNVKLTVWASYAVLFEGRASDEAIARLRDSDSRGNLATALRLRFEDVDNQSAQQFAEAAFGPLDSDLVANWICGASIFSPIEENEENI